MSGPSPFCSLAWRCTRILGKHERQKTLDSRFENAFVLGRASCRRSIAWVMPIASRSTIAWSIATTCSLSRILAMWWVILAVPALFLSMAFDLIIHEVFVLTLLFDHSSLIRVDHGSPWGPGRCLILCLLFIAVVIIFFIALLWIVHLHIVLVILAIFWAEESVQYSFKHLRDAIGCQGRDFLQHDRLVLVKVLQFVHVIVSQDPFVRLQVFLWSNDELERATIVVLVIVALGMTSLKLNDWPNDFEQLEEGLLTSRIIDEYEGIDPLFLLALDDLLVFNDSLEGVLHGLCFFTILSLSVLKKKLVVLREAVKDLNHHIVHG